jgi:aspartyl-tRNA(Asn)/glutamyl-tRNA(Gln) amidotransferase subunit A
VLDVSTLSPVRASFRDALAQIEAYPVELNWRPAFMTPVSALPRLKRKPLADLPRSRPPVQPFSGQKQTIASVRRDLASGTVRAVDVMEAALDAIARRQSELNAFVYVAPAAELLAAAHAIDNARRRGEQLGPLAGIPISVKDLLEVAGMPNTASSPVLAGCVPQRDAGAIRLLKAADALIVGKTQTHEFALGVTTPQSRNPWDATRNPGGSSGGSAIAVATGMSLGSMATDTRASVRVPAALCGVVGYKPTFGLVPGDGVTMLSWSLDHVAHMAGTVEDVALMLNVLAPTPAVDYAASLHKSVRGLRIAMPIAALEGAETGVARAFLNAVEALRSEGAEVVEVDLPTKADFDLAVLMGLVVSRCEAAAYHTAFGERRALYDTLAVAEQLDEASLVSAVAYLQAQRAREDLRARMLSAIAQYDAFLMPTTRVVAPKNDEVDQYFLVLSQNCILWSFIGFPVVSVPCGWTSDRLPAGAQLVAGPHEDARLLAIAAALESALQEQ